jgi:sphingolipid 4-desaturase/C4-monooxygenase
MTTPAAKWHLSRHARLLTSHPEIRQLQGPYAPSLLWILALVTADVGLAWVAARGSWTFVFLSAFAVGAFIAHALGVLIHEGTHNLIVRGSRANKLWLIIANLPLIAPVAIEFRAQHLLHHKYLGEVDGRDTQAPARGEVEFVGASSLRKFASFSMGRFFYKSRPANHVPFDRFMALNWAAQILATALLFWFVGLKGLSFLGMSGLLAFGPHPVGARRLSEHFALSLSQPTVSYYGPLNAVSLHVGHHVEHHDFPAIPWVHLPALRRLGGAEYDDLLAFHSWTGLLLRYFTDRRFRVDQYVGFGAALLDGDEQRTNVRRPQGPSDFNANRAA